MFELQCEGLTRRDAAVRNMNKCRSMRRFCFLILALTAVFIGSKGEESLDGFVAGLSFSKTVENLGTITKDAKPVHLEFPFVNDGNAPLVLTYVHASCSCVRLEYPRAPIAPGDSSKISATFIPASVSSREFKRDILVKSNAKKSMTRLFIVGKMENAEK